jgi:hypothetical protein
VNLSSAVYIVFLAAIGSAIGFESERHSYESAQVPPITIITNNITTIPEAVRIIPDWICTNDKHLVIDLKTGLTCLYGQYWSVVETRGLRHD